jgi:hypothetical protein
VCLGVWEWRRDRTCESVAAALFGCGRADPSLLPSPAVEPGPGCDVGRTVRGRRGEGAEERSGERGGRGAGVSCAAARGQVSTSIMICRSSFYIIRA